MARKPSFPAQEQQPQGLANAAPTRFDLLDNPVAHRLGVGIKREESRGLGAKIRQLWQETFLSDTWHDADFMDDVRQATLRGAHPAARLLFYLLLGFVAFFLVWAALARIDEVTRAEGQVIPSGNVQLVGSPEGGVVQEILVRSGDLVEPGQILVRLDDAQAASGVGEKVSRREFLQANIIRLQAALGQAELVFPPELISTSAPLVDEVTRLYQTRQNEWEATLNVFRQQVEQRRQELADARRRADSQADALRIAQEELDLTRPVFESGAISRADLLRLERAVVEAQREANTARTSVPVAAAALREAEGKLEEARLQFETQARDELGELTEEFERLGEGVQADVARVDRAVLRSPIRAEVKQVLVNTIGQAVQPNTNIVELVPVEETLLVEGRVRPQDVAFIRPGMPAMVKISAYDFAIYGGLEGEVESISADSFTDERASAGGQPETYFKVHVRTKENVLHRFGEELPIKSGMVATADIRTGKKTVLQYLLKPINRARERALTER